MTLFIGFNSEKLKIVIYRPTLFSRYLLDQGGFCERGNSIEFNHYYCHTKSHHVDPHLNKPERTNKI